MKNKKTFFYSENKNEDFGNLGRNNLPLKKDFKYINNNIFYRFFSFILYYLIAKPILWVVAKIVLNVKIKGKENLKEGKKEDGYYIYMNHTHYYDAFLCHVFLSKRKRAYVLSHPDAVNIPFIGHLVMMLGCLPIPDSNDINNYKKFYRALKVRSNKGVIAIYPEGTLWPYYNGLRPFPSTSFKYAAMNNKPIFVCSETYRKGWFNKPKMTITVSKMIRPKKEFSVKENCDYFYNEACKILNENVLTANNYGYYNYELKSKE